MDRFVKETDPVSSTIIQHEERLVNLEKGKPVYEKLADYDDIREILWAASSNDAFRNEFKQPIYVEAYVCVYLNFFICLPEQQKVFHHQEVFKLWGDHELKKLSRWIYYSIRVNTPLIMSQIIRESPFPREDATFDNTPGTVVTELLQNLVTQGGAGTYSFGAGFGL